MESATLTIKGQIVIPSALRNKYGLQPGSKLVFIDTPEGLMIKPYNAKHIASFKGMLPSGGNLKKELKQYKTEDELPTDKKISRVAEPKTRYGRNKRPSK
jgi:AbrB family looped-hinge helix DNA binding protein